MKFRTSWFALLPLLSACGAVNPEPCAPSTEAPSSDVAAAKPAEPLAASEAPASSIPLVSAPGQHASAASVATELRYWIHLPMGYPDREKKYPLIVFLHGGGERGTDLEIVKRHGIPKIAERYPAFPFITVAPQATERWNPALLNQMLDQVLQRYPVDPDRVYLTGISMGGFGSWAWLQENPERFAAAAPICGGGDATKADKLKKLPLWVFHGALDERVPVKESQSMVDAITKAGGDVKFTLYPDLPHDSWTRTYENTELYLWFLKHDRNGESKLALSERDRIFFDDWATLSAIGELEQTTPFPLSTPKAGPMRGKFEAVAKNPSSAAIRVTERFSAPAGSRWTIQPASVDKTLAPGASEKIQFDVAYSGDRFGMFPLPERTVSLFRGQTKLAEVTKPLTFDGDAFFIDNAPLSRAAKAPAPVIDGKLGDAGWRAAPAIVKFWRNADGSASDSGGKVQVAYDAQNLYVAGDTPIFKEAFAHAIETRDGNLWEDDSIEVLIDADLDRTGYAHFVVNSNGALYDAHEYDKSWNGTEEAKAVANDKSWTFELRIPWSDLGVSGKTLPAKIGFQIARNIATGSKKDQWSPSYGTVHQPKRFGAIELKR